MSIQPARISVFAVALLAEGVDRNNPAYRSKNLSYVALLAEGVDRNSLVMRLSRSSR